MKKIVCIIAVVLMIASVVYAAEKKAGITAKDLPAMKGIWTGNMSFGVFEGGGSSACTLEIFNDTVPIKAKLSVSNVPATVAQSIGTQSGPVSGESNDGTLTTQGTILFTGPEKNFFVISKAGEKKIKINYWYRGLQGDATLTKK